VRWGCWGLRLWEWALRGVVELRRPKDHLQTRVHRGAPEVRWFPSTSPVVIAGWCFSILHGAFWILLGAPNKAINGIQF